MKRNRIFAVLFLIMYIGIPVSAVSAKQIDSSVAQVSVIEYVYDGNNRLVGIKKAGVTIATLTYDKNGNLLKIQVIP